MTRKIHGGLAHLFGALIVVQLFLAGLGAFTTVHDKTFKDSNFDPHAALGNIMVLVALVIALIAVAGRWSPRALRFSWLLFGLMVVQSLLAGFGADTAAWIGGLHVVNALSIVAVTGVLIRDARAPATVAAPA